MVYGDYDADGVCATFLLTDVLRQLGADVCWRLPNRFRDGYGLSLAGGRGGRGRRRRAAASPSTAAPKTWRPCSALCDIGVDVVVTDHHELGRAAAAVHAWSRPSWAAIRSRIWPGWAWPSSWRTPCSCRPAARRAPSCPCACARTWTWRPWAPSPTWCRCWTRTAPWSAWASAACAARRARAGRLAGGQRHGAGRGHRRDARLPSGAAHQRGRAAGRPRPRPCSSWRRRTARRLCRWRWRSTNSTPPASNWSARSSRRRRPRIADPPPPALVLYDPAWHEGVLGIVAARLAEEHNRPTILLCGDGELAKGSGRSVPGFDLVSAVAACSGSLERFGGHPAACGLRLRPDRIADFTRQFVDYAAGNVAAGHARAAGAGRRRGGRHRAHAQPGLRAGATGPARRGQPARLAPAARRRGAHAAAHPRRPAPALPRALQRGVRLGHPVQLRSRRACRAPKSATTSSWSWRATHTTATTGPR